MNEKQIYLEALKWLESGIEFGKATVIETWGSSPRPIGSAMIVNQKNQILGSVSGGCIESFVFGKLLETIKNKKHSILEFGVTNSQAWEVGLTCGGKIKLLLEHISEKELNEIKNINMSLSKDPGMVIATRIKDGKKLCFNTLPKDASKGFNSISETVIKKRQSKLIKIDNDDWFFKSYHSKINLIIIGAVHISESLINIAKIVGFETILIDPRNYFDIKKFDKEVKIYNDWPDEALKKIRLSNNCAIVTLTHDPKLDDPAIEYSLKSKAFYIGCLGSIKTHQSRKKRLAKKGFSKAQIDSLFGPVGLEISAKTPAEIACSIISEIINTKNNAI